MYFKAVMHQRVSWHLPKTRKWLLWKTLPSIQRWPRMQPREGEIIILCMEYYAPNLVAPIPLLHCLCLVAIRLLRGMFWVSKGRWHHAFWERCTFQTLSSEKFLLICRILYEKIARGRFGKDSGMSEVGFFFFHYLANNCSTVLSRLAPWIWSS